MGAAHPSLAVHQAPAYARHKARGASLSNVPRPGSNPKSIELAFSEVL
jgi:hypothetical protein